MAFSGQAKERLDSLLAFGAYKQVVKSGDYVLAKPSRPTADPKPFFEVVNRAGEILGKAHIFLGDRQIEASFERYVDDDPQEPSLRVNYESPDGLREVSLEVSTRELRLSAVSIRPGDTVPKPDFPPGMLAAPGATITFLHKGDLERLRRVRQQSFTLTLREGEEQMILYRPVHDSYLISDPSSAKPARVETVPEVPLKELSHISARTAALIAKELDPFIEVGSLHFYEPVEVKPIHPLSKEVANLIAGVLSPQTA